MELKGKHVVITGSLRPLKRVEAIAYLEAAGAIVQGFVSKRTDILIVGHQQLSLFEPEKESRKLLVAKTLKAQGQAIILVTESQFFDWLRTSHLE
ncbi:TPA: BRCT domain-containing protein [Streptococcus agalactiae]|uniref:BRCT domain-containing protein n=1 Tax=Streptococcus agalactiae TaxID=1311 RepID=UPI0013FE138D|nr:BRCT domain-containing protein [Streptococcus agalactiae]MDX5010650.1 BRCT domain-containing protein [Streptococcus agalactiae]HEM9182228.1 BRCT domain-containing protein [Streptococcus agalactiae]HEN4541685.1 BRCT domain-containing protein [Streptococcus agalactiae]HEN4583257.1 BRCT domain-containing protein [Streptococcus agalactiae]HEO4623412.1 BRCT domain-containing protein [Streptococcus agalactiae]